MFPAHFMPEPVKYSSRAEEVVREVNHQPHVLLRVSVDGGFFPERSEPPSMAIVQGEKVVALSWFTEISEDGRSLHGYFATDVQRGTLEFGYIDRSLGRLPISPKGRAVKRLDRGRLEGVVDATSDYLREKRGHD